MRLSRPLRRLAAAACAAALAAGQGPAAAAPQNPLPRYLESLQVGPGSEFRLAVLHPVFAVPPGQREKDPTPAFAATVSADAVGVAPAPRDARSRARIDVLGADPVWFLPGDVLRLEDADYVVRADGVAAPGTPFEAVVTRTSARPDDEKPREQPRVMGALPGPGLLWMLLHGVREKELVATAAELAKEAELDTPRRSPVELLRAQKIAARVLEYRTRLARLAAPPAGGRRRPAGYIVVLDGGYAGFETFGDPARFEALWPRRLEGIAVEAALLELENGLLDQDLAAPTDPDRFLSTVKDAQLALYGLEPEASRLPGVGTLLRLDKDYDLGRAAVHETEGVQHLLWVRDPAHRRVGTDPEETSMEPGVIERKARPTEAEKRWLERRKQAGD